MASSYSIEQLVAPPAAHPTGSRGFQQPATGSLQRDSGTPWNFTTIAALLLLVLLWAVKLHTTWAAWGNLTIDSGREMYVPAALAHGKMLYRDVWYLYGPAAPYWNSLLFRCFGERLEVLYWAGSLSALGTAVLLYLVGIHLSFWLAGWTAGAVVLIEAFQPSLFCFPLAYSFSSVYGCLVACLFLYFAIRASTSTHRGWMFGAGTTAAIALLLKLEFGAACYAAWFLLLVARGLQLRSWKSMWADLASILPGVAICTVVIGWMVSLRGVEFITQENLMSWPTSYFMKTFGKTWLAKNGFAMTGPAFADALYRALPVVATLLIAYCALWWRRPSLFKPILIALLGLYVGFYLVFDAYMDVAPSRRLYALSSTLFFPTNMLLYVVAGAFAAWAHWLWQRGSIDPPRKAFLLLLAFSSLLGFRILLRMTPSDYGIYYNGPAVLSFLLLWFLILAPLRRRSPRLIVVGQLVICLGCLTAAASGSQIVESVGKDFVPLETPRGTVRVSPQVAESYRAALQFMKDASSHGSSVLSVPEDTSLYFLSGTDCPTRIFAFTPGIVSPGKMASEFTQELASKHVRYLLWSNRAFPEYGAPRFGVDFNQELGNYFQSHYYRVGPLVPGHKSPEGVNFTVWEENAAEHRP